MSNARNVGIELSNYPYITFVDGDDSLESTFLEETLNILEDNNLDIIIGGYREIKDGNVIRKRLSYPGIHIYENDKKINFISKLISSKTSDFIKEIDDIKKMIRIICYKRILRRQIKHFGLNNKEAKKSIDYCKKYLIDNVPIIDKLYF